MSTKVADIFAELGIVVPPGEMAKAEAKLKNFGNRADGQLRKVSANFKRHIGSMLISLGGLYAIKEGITKAFNFDESLDRLRIASKGAISDMEAFSDQIIKASNKTGIARESILEAAHSFVAFTGDGKTAQESLAAFAKIAQATGTPITDISKAAGALANNFGITGEQMEKTFSILTEGGKEGAVELSDMASLLAPVTAQFQNFADMKGLEGVAKLGAAFQLTMRGSGSPAEAATRMESLAVALQKKASSIAKATGIDVGQMLKTDGFSKTMAKLDQAIKSKGLSDQDVITMFGRQEAVVAFRQITKVNGEYEKLTDTIKDSNSVSEDFTEVQQKNWFKVKQALNQVKNAFLSLMARLTPAITWLAEHLDGVLIIIGSIVAALAFSKITGVLNGIASLTAGVGKLGNGLSFAAGKASTLMSGLQALGVGLGIGTALDQAFGLSDKISDFAAGGPKVKRIQNINGQLLHPDHVKRLAAMAKGDQTVQRRFFNPQTGKSEMRSVVIEGVTVNTTSSRPQDIANEVVKALNGQLRQAAADTGGQ